MIHRRFAFLLSALIAAELFSAQAAQGQEWSLTTADFHTRPAVLKSLSSDSVALSNGDAKPADVIPLGEFVSIQRPATDDAPAPKFTLLLTNGDRLIGEPSGVVSEKLTWLSPSLGKIPVPFNRIRVIGKGDSVIVPEEPPKQDVVTLANGDTASGVFVGASEGNVTLQADAGPTTIPLNTVSRIAFAATGAAAVDPARAFRIHLADGSIISAPEAHTQTAAGGDQLVLLLPGKNAATVSVPMMVVLGIEQINGPVSWLSDRPLSENIQTPYFGGAPIWPARFDQAVDGSPLVFEGKRFDRGIGVHAYSKLSFDLEPQWKSFRTQYAIASHRDEPAKFADVNVRIKLDGKVVHEQQHLREGELSPVIQLDLNGASSLTLECDYGSSGSTQANLNWLQPALLRTSVKPTTAPSTAP